MSGSAFRRMCKAEFLHYLRDPRVAGPAPAAPTGRQAARGSTPRAAPARASSTWTRCTSALLAGLLSHVGVPRRAEARVRRRAGRPVRHRRRVPACSASSPSSSWPSELVETSRLWARDQRAHRPAVGRAGSASTSSSGSTPSRGGRASGASPSRRSGSRSTGCRSSSDASSGYARVDPPSSRATSSSGTPSSRATGHTEHAFLHDNAALVERLAELEARTRRRDIVVDDEHAVSRSTTSGFPPRWCRRGTSTRGGRRPRRQDAGPADLHRGPAAARERGQHRRRATYPTTGRRARPRPAVTYQFEPGSAQDGVTVHVPVERAQPGDARRASTGRSPGFREELVTALIRSLPKGIRRNSRARPRPRAAPSLPELDPSVGPACSTGARRRCWPGGPGARGVAVSAAGLRRRAGAGAPAGHLQRRRRSDGRAVATGKDLEAVRDAAAPAAAPAGEPRRVRSSGPACTSFPGEVPEEVATTSAAGRLVQGYPALVDDRAPPSTCACCRPGPRPTPSTASGCAGCSCSASRPPWKQILARLTQRPEARPRRTTRTVSVPALLDDCLACAVDAIATTRNGCRADGPQSAAAFAWALDGGAHPHAARVVQVVGLVEPILAKDLAAVRPSADSTDDSADAAPGSLADVRAQLRELVRPGFVADAGLRPAARPGPLPAGHAPPARPAPANLARDARATDHVDPRRGPPTPTCSSPCAPPSGRPPTSSTSAG